MVLDMPACPEIGTHSRHLLTLVQVSREGKFASCNDLAAAVWQAEAQSGCWCMQAPTLLCPKLLCKGEQGLQVQTIPVTRIPSSRFRDQGNDVTPPRTAV